MIYVNRTQIEKPAIFESTKMVEEFEKMKRFHLEEDYGSKFKRYRFSSILTNSKIKEAVKHLFNGKCAYCESSIGANDFGDIDLFRPKSGAMNTDGSFDPDHYWWLAYEWNNLYLSCQVCNQRYKRNNFPVKGLRAAIMGDLSVEDPLLLDPCQYEDFIEQHIGYEKERAIPLTERGNSTIKILGLNREELLIARKKELRALDAAIKTGPFYQASQDKKSTGYDMKRIDRLISPDSPFLACKWANYWVPLTEAKKGYLPDYLPFYEKKRVFKSKKRTTTQAQITSVKEPARKAYSLDKMNEGAKNEYFGQSRWITKVKIKNFKIIEDLELEFSSTDTTNKIKDFKEPWMALLGENGTGKSTVLQAIALTLAGEERLNRLNLNASKFVNRNTNEDSGWVKVYLNDRKTPITLNISKSSNSFSITPKAPQLIVRSYGSTRLFSKDPDNLHEKDFLFIENLFDPLVLLLNGNKWLIEKINDEKLFPEIAKSLSDLLSLNEDQYFYPDKDEKGNPIVCLQLYPNKKGIPLDDLSAGYKAILALGLDIMMGFGQIWPSIFNAQGIVLVDEIGVHLHPRWKMRIINALRKTFPGINFIIATHEPLCLRGLEEGEVILMNLDESKNIEIITDLPSPKRMRVGQLLTSVFGLYTTMDPELEKLYSEFYHLQGLRKMTIDENDRFEELKDILKDDIKEDPVTGEQRLEAMLGEDMREMLGFEIIEQKIADYKTGKSRPNLKDLKKETLDEVKKLWES
ncbi:AAA family ATPase [Flavivirga aquimarina]|uniref:AAA family ATPase n=1 Tax=Flavivirga aquimarina TaxID=2027862 RepID=A0ABT8WE39_9FLAO|nr:AAA family ATPase [Flavivirga aquimarina]MDO5971428.1 AAA family ATPase [Flavivirga aquimarina]